MSLFLTLFVAIPAVTFLVDLLWWLERRDWRRAVEKNRKACDGRIRSPSGFFTTACSNPALLTLNGHHVCLSFGCLRHGQSKGNATRRPDAK